MEQNSLSKAQEFYWGSINWLIEPNADTSRVSLGLVCFAPRMTQKEHSHIREEQVIYVISGHGYHYVDGQYSALSPGDCIHLPPHSRHELTNESDEELHLLIVYTPSKIQHMLSLPVVEGPGILQDIPTQPFFDADIIAPFIHKFSEALGLSLAILDTNAKCILKTENHPRMCSHLAQITQGQYCQYYLQKVFNEITDYNQPHFFFCCCNIASIIIPISYAGKIQAYLKCGEIFLSKEDKEQLVRDVPQIAQKYNINLDFMYAAADELPIEPKSRLHVAAEATFAISSTIVNIMADALRQKELNTSRLSLVREQLASAKLEKSFNELNFKFLQSQVNPHFLFNTLNTIAQMAYIEGATKIADLTYNLSELLRFTLRKTEQLIPLHEELALLKNYISIQKERFGDRINFQLDIDESLNNSMVPCLLFQPLVENSIIHGLETKAEGGSIKVTVKRKNGLLNAAVIDDGIGFDLDALKTRTDKIGINSTKIRLAHYFGSNHQFEIFSKPNKGTTISIEFPIGEKYD